KAPPRAPVLYVKTANTRAADGAAVAVPVEPGMVRVDATLGLVIGRGARRVPVAQALHHVRGYVIASDLTLPHDSVFRPAVRQRCGDGFCPLSAEFGARLLPDPGLARIDIRVDGELVHQRSLATTLLRSAAQLLADVTEFMTLEVGDILLLGAPDDAPLARAGQSVRIDVAGLGSLSHRLVAEPAAALQAAQARSR
ncbi:MAG: fumarylacetoacetate hydrolase family protein, partial [Rhizobacter sp.]|nr:fumarylacetoacetate hydrolase family protein [Rhizobacter sp.]